MDIGYAVRHLVDCEIVVSKKFDKEAKENVRGRKKRTV